MLWTEFVDNAVIIYEMDEKQLNQIILTSRMNNYHDDSFTFDVHLNESRKAKEVYDHIYNAYVNKDITFDIENVTTYFNVTWRIKRCPEILPSGKYSISICIDCDTKNLCSNEVIPHGGEIINPCSRQNQGSGLQSLSFAYIPVETWPRLTVLTGESF